MRVKSLSLLYNKLPEAVLGFLQASLQIFLVRLQSLNLVLASLLLFAQPVRYFGPKTIDLKFPKDLVLLINETDTKRQSRLRNLKYMWHLKNKLWSI
jgi:hypothetical protein